MLKRISLTISDELAERLNILADYYDLPVLDMIRELLTDGATVCETAIKCEACAQIAWLAQVEPDGRA